MKFARRFPTLHKWCSWVLDVAFKLIFNAVASSDSKTLESACIALSASEDLCNTKNPAAWRLHILQFVRDQVIITQCRM